MTIQLEEKATGSGITVSGYIEVQSLPYAYDQGAEAKPDDIESAPVVWCLTPPLRVVARSGGIGRGILHPTLWMSEDDRSLAK